MISIQSARRPRRSLTTLVGLALVAIAMAGCGPSVSNPVSIDSAQAMAQRGAATDYVLQPGDELDVRFYYNPELNQSVLVRPDGKISLPLANEVQAAGLTPAQLTDRLRALYERELRRPEITVMVRSFNSQRVYVGGEVAAPGVVQALGPLSVLQSVTQAGGFRETAYVSEVLVIRRNPAGQNPVVIPVNVASIINGSNTAQDIALVPYDIVYVPKSPVANVNKFVDQYIRQNIPFGFGLAYGFGN